MIRSDKTDMISKGLIVGMCVMILGAIILTVTSLQP